MWQNLLITETDLISIDHVDFLLGGCPGTLELVHPWNPEILVGRSDDLTQLLDVFLEQPTIQWMYQLYRLNYVFLKWTSQRFQDYYEPDCEMYWRFLYMRLQCINILVSQDVTVSVGEHGMCVDPTHNVPLYGQLCVLNLTLIGSWKNNQSNTTSLFYTKWSFSHLKAIGFINNSHYK